MVRSLRRSSNTSVVQVALPVLYLLLIVFVILLTGGVWKQCFDQESRAVI